MPFHLNDLLLPFTAGTFYILFSSFDHISFCVFCFPYLVVGGCSYTFTQLYVFTCIHLCILQSPRGQKINVELCRHSSYRRCSHGGYIYKSEIKKSSVLCQTLAKHLTQQIMVYFSSYFLSETYHVLSHVSCCSCYSSLASFPGSPFLFFVGGGESLGTRLIAANIYRLMEWYPFFTFSCIKW